MNRVLALQGISTFGPTLGENSTQSNQCSSVTNRCSTQSCAAECEPLNPGGLLAW
jgi:hypothetical protein